MKQQWHEKGLLEQHQWFGELEGVESLLVKLSPAVKCVSKSA